MKARILAEENRKWWTLAAVSFALFMIMLDNTVVNVALPAIQRDLGIGVSELEWVVTGYALSFAVLMLTGGKLADMLGRRRIFLIGLAVFTVSSLLCGLAGSAELLIGARVLQGVGAACMMPATLSIITATFAAQGARRRARHLGGRLGDGARDRPAVGGLITENIGWNWIFYINVPVGIVGLVAGRLIIPESKDTSREQRLDLPGLITSGVALFALVYALIEANSRGWTSPLILGLFALALVSGTAFVLLELHQRLPLFDMTPLPQPDVRRREHRRPARLARDVRGLLLHLALHAERARLQRRPRRCGVPADDDPDHPRRPDRRARRPTGSARAG